VVLPVAELVAVPPMPVVLQFAVVVALVPE